MNTLGTTLQGLTTVACVVFNKAAYNALFERIKTFHCTISEHKAEEAVKARYRSLIQLVIKLYVLAFVVGAFGIDFLPIPLTILTGVKTLPFGQNIPFIDHTTSPGYEITYIYQIFLTFLCVPNMCGFQSLYVIAMGHFCCVGDLLVEKIMRKEEHGENKRFREILTLHYEFMDLHNLVEGLYGYYNTVLIMTTGLSVALGIVVLMRYSWIQGYIFIIMGFTNLLVTCIYGHLVETKTEKLEKALFNDLNWISMSTSDQRSAVLMLHMVQNKQQFCSGKLFILGFDLYVLVRISINCN